MGKNSTAGSFAITKNGLDVPAFDTLCLKRMPIAEGPTRGARCMDPRAYSLASASSWEVIAHDQSFLAERGQMRRANAASWVPERWAIWRLTLDVGAAQMGL